ncbi:MAG TPA: Cof-type HAD-IIB family hydrolase [Candidatus Mediterraneibacter merdigallinarum]|nr:Cof-type HAD-IIB family hydrolase [Candidatus Mediterraneibacter merdigallinarum]
MNLPDYKNIKIAFFDIDGTMIDIGSRKITPNMLETLSGLQRNGIKICIATGRPPAILPHFQGIDFDAYLTFNASYCYTKEEVIFRNPIPAADVQTVIRNAAKIHRPLALAGADRMGANGSDTDLEDYFAISQHNLEIIEDFDELSREEIFQIMIGCRKEEYATVLEDVKGARITAWWDRAADIISATGSKGYGIEKVLEYYHLDRKQAIAFGDGANDIEMLQTVGLGVAMGNAGEDVKAAADQICGTAAEDGIFTYCRNHGLI